MDFSETVCTYGGWSFEQNVTSGFLLAVPLVLVGLFVWRLRGARDARDVLRLGPPGQDERETPSS